MWPTPVGDGCRSTILPTRGELRASWGYQWCMTFSFQILIVFATTASIVSKVTYAGENWINPISKKSIELPSKWSVKSLTAGDGGVVWRFNGPDKQQLSFSILPPGPLTLEQCKVLLGTIYPSTQGILPQDTYTSNKDGQRCSFIFHAKDGSNTLWVGFIQPKGLSIAHLTFQASDINQQPIRGLFTSLVESYTAPTMK